MKKIDIKALKDAYERRFVRAQFSIYTSNHSKARIQKFPFHSRHSCVS
jgi:hypothetical protein